MASVIQCTRPYGGQPVAVLDGGMGHLLKRNGVKIEGPVGSIERFLGVALANVETPDLVKASHLAYIDAGCDIITTNSYSVVPRCLALNSKDGTEFTLPKLLEAAGSIARAAANARPDRKVFVAGDIPPLNASYRPDLVGSFEDNLRDYRIITQGIAEYCDVLLCETMSTALEGKAAATAALETGKPVWLSFTLAEDEPTLRSGESISQMLEVLGEEILSKVDAVMFNCTSPEMISKALPLLVEDPLLPNSVAVGGYANGFVTCKSGSGDYRDLAPDEYWSEFARRWMETCAETGERPARPVVLGGCCGIFPEHIQYMADAVAEARNS